MYVCHSNLSRVKQWIYIHDFLLFIKGNDMLTKIEELGPTVIIKDNPLLWFDFNNDFQWLPDPVKDILLEHGLVPYDAFTGDNPWKICVPDENISKDLVDVLLGCKEEILYLAGISTPNETEWYTEMFDELEKTYC